MEKLSMFDLKRSSIKTLAITLIMGLTIISCQDSVTTTVETTNEKVDLEEVYASKLGPDMTLEMALEEWGITREELEAAYYAGKNRTKTKSTDSLSSDPPPSWESEYGTGLNLGADDCKNVEIGFPFTFYGETYTTLWVNSNGNVTFDACNTRWWPTNIPDTGGKVIIGALYGDFEPQQTDGDVYTNIVGTEPNRTFVVTWLEVPGFEDDDSEVNTFQLQLAEGTNSILLGYNGLATDGINSNNNKPMNVGISADSERYINSASGEEIPALDGTNICYKLEDGEYEEILGPCEPSNNPPIADAGPDQTVECAGDSTTVALDGSGSSDPDEDSLTYSWNLNGTEIATGTSPAVDLPMGSHTILLTVTDTEGASNSDEVVVDIVDTTAPELTYTVNTTRLWPPNGEMHLTVSDISIFDVCDSEPDLMITIVENDKLTEPVNWEVVENSDGTFDVYLRAEKNEEGGNNSSREYVVVLTGVDASGNIIEESVEVTVPHDMRGSSR